MERILSGIHGLDQRTSGLIKKGLTFVCGEREEAETFGIQYLVKRAEKGERGLYITLKQNIYQIRELGKKYNWDIKKLEKLGLIEIYNTAMPDEIRAFEEVNLDGLRAILEHYKDEDFQHIVLEGIEEITAYFARPRNFYEELRKIKKTARELGFTFVFVAHKRPETFYEKFPEMSEIIDEEYFFSHGRVRITFSKRIRWYIYMVLKDGLHIYDP